MQKNIKQIFAEYLSQQKKKSAPRTYKYYDEAIRYLENCLNGYASNYLDEKDSKKFDKKFKDGVEFCDIFEPQVLSDSNFSEFLGYYYPKKIACGRDMAQKICGATIALYKWMVENKYIFQEEGDAIELSECVSYLRESFKEGMDEYCNFDEDDVF